MVKYHKYCLSQYSVAVIDCRRVDVSFWRLCVSSMIECQVEWPAQVGSNADWRLLARLDFSVINSGPERKAVWSKQRLSIGCSAVPPDVAMWVGQQVSADWLLAPLVVLPCLFYEPLPAFTCPAIGRPSEADNRRTTETSEWYLPSCLATCIC